MSELSDNNDACESCWLPDDLTYDGWISYVFDHPILDPAWYFRDGRLWKEDKLPEIAVDYMTRLFSEPAFLIDRFTHAQIDQGLGFLVNNSCSNHMFVLCDTSLPWESRRACFDAMIPLYERLMAPLYKDDLGHLHTSANSGDADKPNYACYMWWDIIPIYGGMDHADSALINDAVLHVFEETLKLSSEACLESALHGLGHWYSDVPDRTTPLVRAFLSRADISPALRRYAEKALIGSVL